MKKQLVIIGIITLLICVGLSGCNEQNTGQNVVTTNDDTAFKNWMTSSMSVLLKDGEGISTATDNYDFSSLEYWFHCLKEDTNLYKTQINSFSVSSNWQSIKNEYKSALNDYYLAGYYGEIGIKNFNNDYLVDGYDYLDKGTAHIHNINSHLN